MENKIYRKYPFWCLAGPLLGFLAIQGAVRFAIQFAMELPYALQAYAGIMRDASAGGAVSMEEIMEAYLQAMEPALQLISAHRVEIAAAASLATVILTGILFAKDRKLEKKAGVILPEKARAGRYWMLAVFGFAGSLAATCLMTMMQAAFYDSLYQQTSGETYSSPFVIQLICLGFVIPLAEEFMFRGVLYKRYRERQNFWYSAIGSSILFSLMHVSMTQMFYTFLLGLMLAYVYEKFGSFCAPLALHIFVNMGSVIFTETGLFLLLIRDPLVLAGAAIGGAFICSVMFVLIQRTGNVKIST